MIAVPEPGFARRRRLIRTGIAIAVLLVVLVLSALMWPGQRSDALSVPTADSPAGASGTLTGTLRAVRTGDRVCFAVSTPDGPAPLVLPRGWAADRRLDLLDPSGFVIARPGEAVRVTGDPGAVGVAPGCTGRGRVWRVVDVGPA